MVLLLPLLLVAAVQPQPSLSIGSEVAPIVALQRVRAALDPALLRGTVLIVHVANLPSFLGRTVYYSPIDGKNLNRVYPGKADGTVSDRIAYAITNQIIARTDFLVDIHATATSLSGRTLIGVRSVSTPGPIRSRGRWRSPGAAITSSSTPCDRVIQRPRCTRRTPRTFAASRR